MNKQNLQDDKITLSTAENLEEALKMKYEKFSGIVVDLRLSKGIDDYEGE